MKKIILTNNNVIDFDPIKISTHSTPQNDLRILLKSVHRRLRKIKMKSIFITLINLSSAVQINWYEIIFSITQNKFILGCGKKCLFKLCKTPFEVLCELSSNIKTFWSPNTIRAPS
jgi:hypothetical protein